MATSENGIKGPTTVKAAPKAPDLAGMYLGPGTWLKGHGNTDLKEPLRAPNPAHIAEDDAHEKAQFQQAQRKG